MFVTFKFGKGHKPGKIVFYLFCLFFSSQGSGEDRLEDGRKISSSPLRHLALILLTWLQYNSNFSMKK